MADLFFVHFTLMVDDLVSEVVTFPGGVSRSVQSGDSIRC